MSHIMTTASGHFMSMKIHRLCPIHEIYYIIHFWTFGLQKLMASSAVNKLTLTTLAVSEDGN
jgi:hypothetical protein